MEIHSDFCENIIQNFKTEHNQYCDESENVISALNQMLQDQVTTVANSPPLLKPFAEEHQEAISLRIQFCKDQQRETLQQISNKWIRDAMDGHSSLEDHQEIQAEKMAFRQLLINKIRATPQFQPSLDVMQAMEDFLVDECALDEDVIRLFRLMNTQNLELRIHDNYSDNEYDSMVVEDAQNGWVPFFPMDDDFERGSSVEDGSSNNDEENSD